MGALNVNLTLGVWLCGILMSTGCAPLANNPWPSNLDVTSQAFSIIESQYLDYPDFSKLREGAILGLTKLHTPESLALKRSGDDLLIGYRSFGQAMSWKTVSQRPDRETALRDIRFVYEIVRQIKPEISEELLESTMLESAVAQLDTQSSFLDRASTREFRGDVAGKMGGIGLEFTIREKEVRVVSAIDGAPAQRVGISRDDRILKIDGASTNDRPLRDIVRQLRGPLGSTVTVTIVRDGWADAKDFTLQRSPVRTQSIQSRLLENGIGLIVIRQIAADAVRTLESALQGLEKGGLQRLILDLRGNTGGLFVQAPQVAGKFLQSGALITYTKARAPDQSNQRYINNDAKPRVNLPLAILVDKNTAAGAELVAGILQEYGRAVLIGERTLGTATIQTVLPLPGESMLRLTTARWFTPKGTSVDHTGLQPDFVVEVSTGGERSASRETAQDLALQRAVEIIKDGERH